MEVEAEVKAGREGCGIGARIFQRFVCFLRGSETSGRVTDLVAGSPARKEKKKQRKAKIRREIRKKK